VDGWPIFALHHRTEGAPSLRFLQGWAAMLPAQLSSVLRCSLCNAVVLPALRKVREGRGTRAVAAPAV
jgi:hypothetical protein